MSLRLRFIFGLTVDGLAFLIQPYYLLSIMYLAKWMTFAFTNVRAAKTKLVSTKTVTEAQHYILSSGMHIEPGIKVECFKQS